MANNLTGNFAANGSSAVFWCTDNFESNDGVYIKVYGDFGGGTVAIEEDQGDGNYTAKKCGKFISNAEKIVRIPNGTKFRLTLSGATSPDLDYYIANMSYRGAYE